MTARWLEDGVQELRFGFRTLARRTRFMATVAGILGTTIAVTTTVFSAVHAVLLKPLPYRDPSRHIFIWDNTFRDRNLLCETSMTSGG